MGLHAIAAHGAGQGRSGGGASDDVMKFTSDRPSTDPDKAARRLMEPRAFEPAQDGRISIENLNGPVLFDEKGTPAKPLARCFSPFYPPKNYK
jgi:hypothetical protein